MTANQVKKSRLETQLAVRAKTETIDKIDLIAGGRGVKRSSIIREALTEYVNKEVLAVS